MVETFPSFTMTVTDEESFGPCPSCNPGDATEDCETCQTIKAMEGDKRALFEVCRSLELNGEPISLSQWQVAETLRMSR
jgi:hypothetical protein